MGGTKSSKKGIFMLIILWCAYVIFAMNWISGSNLTSEIIETFFKGDVEPIIQQVVNYTITAARVVANFVAAYVLIKKGPKKAVSISLFFLMFSVVAIWMPNYWLYTIARMVMALGGSMVVVYMNPVVSNYIVQEKKMIANACNTVSYNVGAFITSILFVTCARQLKADWKITLSIMAVLTIILFLLWIVFAEDFETKTNVSSENGNNSYSYAEALRDPFVWNYSVGFSGFLFLYVLAVTSFPSVISQYAPRMNGSLLNMLVTGFAILGTVVGMRIGLTDVNRKKILLLSGMIMIGAYAIVLLCTNSHPMLSYICAAISGFFMYIQYPIYMNLPHEMPNMYPQKVTVIFSLCWAISYTIYTIFTIIWSLLLGSFGWGVASIFYIIASSLYVVMVMRQKETKF